MSINLFNDRVVCDILTRMTVDETHARTFIQFILFILLKVCQLRIGRMVRLSPEEDSVLLENYEFHDIMHWYNEFLS